jgi:hypothetical protein
VDTVLTEGALTDDATRKSAYKSACAAKVTKSVVKRPAPSRFYHIAQAASRRSIDVHGLRASTGWSSGSGVFVTTNPEGWLFMFEDDGIYATTVVDIWEVDVSGFALEPDDNETATVGEDFIVPRTVPRSRVRLAATLARRPGSYEWREE